ncbi:MAG: signal peptidase II [Lachnospiraceae bacterium]|nr:signal peptidase II [Lachnospiraceae bacterium]
MKTGRNSINLIFIILLAGADQLTKGLIVSFVKGRGNIVLIKGVLELEYFENFGAAFNSLVGQRILLIFMTSLLILFLLWKLFRSPDEKRYFGMRLCLCLAVGGALGNLIDRIVKGYVVDFIYFTPINFPKFNFADMCVTGGVIALGALMMFYYKEEEVDYLLGIKGKG